MSNEQSIPKNLEGLLYDLRAYAQEASQSKSEESMIDCAAVLQSALGMVEKMRISSEKGRGGWHDPQRCSLESLTRMFLDHIQKGDMIDVMNFAMMVWSRGAGQFSSKAEMAAFMTEQLKEWAKVDLLSDLYGDMHDTYESELKRATDEFKGLLGLKENPTFGQLTKAEKVIGEHLSLMINQVVAAMLPASCAVQFHQLDRSDKTVKILISFVRTHDVEVPLDGLS